MTSRSFVQNKEGSLAQDRLPDSAVEIQQTETRYLVNSGNRTRSTLVEGGYTPTTSSTQLLGFLPFTKVRERERVPAAYVSSYFYFYFYFNSCGGSSNKDTNAKVINIMNCCQRLLWTSSVSNDSSKF